MGRKRRRSHKRKKKNSKGIGWVILFSSLAFLYLLGKFGWWVLGFAVVIPIIKYLYERRAASVKGKSPEPPEIPSSLTVTFQSQTSSVKPQQKRYRLASTSTSKEDVEKIAIQLARKFGGHLTPVELSLHTSLSLDEANEALKKLVQKGHVNLTTTEKGTFLYLFPGFLDVDKKPSPKKQTQETPQKIGQTHPSHISQMAKELSFPVLEFDLSREERSLRKSLSEQWVSPGNSILVNGYTIFDGMVYVGHEDSSSDKNEPSLIDPSLPVKAVSHHRFSEPLSYFPTYADITPEARTIYLSWLSGGRNDQRLDIGYVFLFFYGLERRILLDIHRTPELQQELPGMISEVKRLLSIYNANPSFFSYATSFLTFILAKYYPEQLKVTKDELKERDAFPFSLKYALAQFSAKNQPLPAPVAFTWFERSPYASLRTPAKRCRTEFFNLFKIRYHAEFGKGFLIEPHAHRYLSVEYRPANSSLREQTYFYELDGFPDVSGLDEPIAAFQKIVDACIEDLEPFSRYLGRKSNQTKPGVFALAQLPAELLDPAHYDEIETLRDFMENTIDSQTCAIIETSELFTAMKLSPQEALSHAESLLAAQLLGRLGYGIEPDVRFNGQRFTPQKKSVLFKLVESPSHTASAEYTFAALLLILASLIVHADGTVTESEEEHLRTHIATILALTPGEHQRLGAYLTLLLVEPPSLHSVKKHVHSLPTESKQAIADFLIALSTTDGHVAPEEIDILKKLYTILELDDDSLYSAIHAIQTQRDTTLEDVFQGGGTPVGRTFEKTGISLDMNLIAYTLQQTEQVQALLADVFEEAPEENPLSHQSTTSPVEEIQCLPHLDVNHSALFHQIAHLERISLDDFTMLCKQFNVLPGGAIETLNTAAFEAVDEALIDEDGDILLLNQNVAREMSV